MKPFFIHLSYSILVTFMIASSSASQSSIKNDNALLDTLSVKDDFMRYFESCGAEGSIVIFDNNKKKWIVSDTTTIYSETLPASTFKIINLLIALETGVIASEKDTIKWPGKTDTIKYGYRPEIYFDMTIKEAFEVSAGWVFNELSQKIGKENYNHYLKICNYGNQNITEPGDDFWNFGAFGISPVNQVRFLRNFYEGKIPFSAKNMEIVKQVMITEQTKDYTIRAKTGWTREGGINTGWWVGYVETKHGVWFFATRLLQSRKNNRADFGPCRKEITKAVLKELAILNPN